MVNRIAVLAAALMLFSNCFAGELENISRGRIIEQQDWTSQSIEVKKVGHKNFSTTRKLLQQQMTPKKSDAGRSGILLRTVLFDKEESIVVGQQSAIPGTTEVYIENLTDVPHRYKVSSSICLGLDDRCASNSMIIELDPTGIYQAKADQDFNNVFDRPGTYTAWLTVMAEEEGQSPYLATYDQLEYVVAAQ